MTTKDINPEDYTDSDLNAFTNSETDSDNEDKTEPTETNNNDEETEAGEQTDTDDQESDADSQTEQYPDFNTGSKIGDEFLHEEVGATLSSGTGDNYESCLRVIFRDFDEQGVDVLTAEVQHVRDHLKKEARRSLRQSTLNVKYYAIKALYRYLRLSTDYEFKMDLWALDEIDINNFQVKTAMEREPLEDDEIEDLFDAMKCFRDRLMVAVGVELGPRNRDIRNIKLEQINLDERIIELTDTKSNETYEMPISDALARKLKHWIEVVRPTYPTADNSEYLFVTDQSKYMDDTTLTNIVREAAERAGIQEVIGESPCTEAQQKAGFGEAREWHKVTPHTLRHTFSERLADAGVNLEARSDAMNHDSIEVTKDYGSSSTDYEEMIRSLVYTESDDDEYGSATATTDSK